MPLCVHMRVHLCVRSGVPHCDRGVAECSGMQVRMLFYENERRAEMEGAREEVAVEVRGCGKGGLALAGHRHLRHQALPAWHCPGV